MPVHLFSRKYRGRGGHACRWGTPPGQCCSCRDQINSCNIEAGSHLCGGISLDWKGQGSVTINHDEKWPQSQIQDELIFAMLLPSPHLISLRSAASEVCNQPWSQAAVATRTGLIIIHFTFTLQSRHENVWRSNASFYYINAYLKDHQGRQCLKQWAEVKKLFFMKLSSFELWKSTDCLNIFAITMLR